MLEKIYFAILGMYFITAGAVAILGMMTAGVAVAFGFVFFGLIYMGMIGILPEWAVHNVEVHR